MPVIMILVTAFASIVSFIIKHPFVSKMMIFGLFIALVGFGVSYMKDIVAPYIIDNSLFSLAGYFGVLDGLSLYLTIILAGFGMKQILAFIRS